MLVLHLVVRMAADLMATWDREPQTCGDAAMHTGVIYLLQKAMREAVSHATASDPAVVCRCSMMAWHTFCILLFLLSCVRHGAVLCLVCTYTT